MRVNDSGSILFVEADRKVIYKNKQYFSDQEKIKDVTKLTYKAKVGFFQKTREVNIFFAIEDWNIATLVSTNSSGRTELMESLLLEVFRFLEIKSLWPFPGASVSTFWETMFSAFPKNYGWLLVNRAHTKAYKISDKKSKIEATNKW
jgi:hypothetical protein